jgi:hypothetical protein
MMRFPSIQNIDVFCKELCGKGIPSFVNRLASIGSALGISPTIKEERHVNIDPEKRGDANYSTSKPMVNVFPISSLSLSHLLYLSFHIRLHL